MFISSPLSSRGKREAVVLNFLGIYLGNKKKSKIKRKERVLLSFFYYQNERAQT